MMYIKSNVPAFHTRGARQTLKISLGLIPPVSLLHLTAVGYMGLQIFCGEGYVTNVAVLPEYRRQGIAQKLILKELENEMNFITLEVRKSNAPAINLYQKMGFENVGIRPRFYTAPDEDAVIMTKNIKPGE